MQNTKTQKSNNRKRQKYKSTKYKNVKFAKFCQQRLTYTSTQTKCLHCYGNGFKSQPCCCCWQDLSLSLCGLHLKALQWYLPYDTECYKATIFNIQSGKEQKMPFNAVQWIGVIFLLQLSMVPGAWCLVPGAWCMHGVLGLVHGVWFVLQLSMVHQQAWRLPRPLFGLGRQAPVTVLMQHSNVQLRCSAQYL